MFCNDSDKWLDSLGNIIKITALCILKEWILWYVNAAELIIPSFAQLNVCYVLYIPLSYLMPSIQIKPNLAPNSLNISSAVGAVRGQQGRRERPLQMLQLRTKAGVKRNNTKG